MVCALKNGISTFSVIFSVTVIKKSFWFTCFFPFLKNGSRRTNPIRFDEELQPEVQKIPLLLEIGHEGVYNCEIHAGFVGLTQNNETASIKPEI